MTRFKICGLREAEHAVAAADAGADFLGFNFVPGVRRQLTVERAKEIIAEYRSVKGRGGPRLVGLFANQPLSEVNGIIRTCGLELAQLCGDETPEFWEAVESPVIRQIRVREEALREDTLARVSRAVEQVAASGQTPLLDRHVSGALGGTGRSFDWSIAAEMARSHEIMLAGGLMPENVGEAIGTARPWAVDVSSGVETDGTKDPAKIAAFAESVRRAG